MGRLMPGLPDNRLLRYNACMVRSFWLPLVAAVFASIPALAADRVALIIGNSKYKALHQLLACANDARTMAATFGKIGVRVHGGKPLLDLDVEQMDTALNEFIRGLGQDSEAFIYYSGHGAQIGGINYILPVSFNAKFEAQAKRQAVSLDDILERLERTTTKLRVVILDACRDAGNLLPGEPSTKGLHSKGLDEQKVDAPETLVCFATKHGTVSLADDTSSFYTRVLAEELAKPGEIGAIMRTVAKRVYQATDKQQLPFIYGSLLEEHFLAGSTAAQIPPATWKMRASDRYYGPLFPFKSVTEATMADPFVNSLGMKFVPVPGTKVLFSIWETRVQEYETFARATGHEVKKPDFAQGPTHPAVNVSWDDAQAFCAWLSKKERRMYRLATDAEWSMAIGLGIESGGTPSDMAWRAGDKGYLWDGGQEPLTKGGGSFAGQWPPPRGAGNFADETSKTRHADWGVINGYADGFTETAPAGSFTANQFGIYDLAGNVQEWCEDWFSVDHSIRVFRGGAWNVANELELLSAYRAGAEPASRRSDCGFRCVLELPAK